MVNLKRQDYFYTVAFRNGTQVEIDEELFFSSVKNAIKYLEVHNLKQKGYEVYPLTKKELLKMRWHQYEKFADYSDNYWNEHPELMRAMYDIVDGLRVALEDNGIHEQSDNVKNISIASYSEPYDGKRIWPNCVRLRAEFNAKGSIILYVDGWPMGFYDEGREQLSIVVCELSNAKELFMWLGQWTEAVEECKEATLKTIKRRYLKELMQLPNDSLDGSF